MNTPGKSESGEPDFKRISYFFGPEGKCLICSRAVSPIGSARSAHLQRHVFGGILSYRPSRYGACFSRRAPTR
jgi:hypothetical protein